MESKAYWTKTLRASSVKLGKVRTQEQKVWEEHLMLIEEALGAGMSLGTISAATGVSKARISQIKRKLVGG